MNTLPEVGLSKAPIIFNNVDFPLPEGPTIDTNSPLFAEKLTFLRDTTLPIEENEWSGTKGFDTFGSGGPWLTSSDDIPDLCGLHITTKIDREIRQDSSTKNLILKIDKIICNLSKKMTLEPIDIIFTGTPSGAALSFSSDLKYLKHNDVVEVEF